MHHKPDSASRALYKGTPTGPAAPTANVAPPPDPSPPARPTNGASPATGYPASLDEKALTLVIFGASGDLALKKTFPALFQLFCKGLLPRHVNIIGYARTAMTTEEFRARMGKHFDPRQEGRDTVEAFLNRLHYCHGAYDKDGDFQTLANLAGKLEAADPHAQPGTRPPGPVESNRLFYLALSPSLFGTVAKAVSRLAKAPAGFNRVIVEKPFGTDLDTYKALSKELAEVLEEDQIYRIDHYLGKEMVQNILALRFANKIFSDIWNKNFIANVQITFKEPFGTDGRGGYFDKVGIIRDITQNHLIQILCLLAMEKPRGLDENSIRDAKVDVLRHVQPVGLEDCVFGQYQRAWDGKGQSYREDPTVPKGTRTPTFAACSMRINNDRWAGVPFLLKAGKATGERKCEVRIQFKDELLPFGDRTKRNELVIRIQPEEAVYLKIMAKKPGLSHEQLVQTELDLTYRQRYQDLRLPDAYEGLIFDALRGQQANFVRDDELEAAWKIFTPLLRRLDAERPVPEPYVYGTRGPAAADQLAARLGYVYNEDYMWK
jgi:glucose-6-phosphate 1-dehydrogenase